MKPEPLPRAFYARDALDVAPELLNKVLVRGGRAARLVEVEAYRGEHDPASHAFRGKTRRNATMFGPAGHVYVYFTYGMHWCANAVCGADGEAMAVLLRAAAPLSGLDEMWAARPRARRERDLCSGPAKLCQAFGVTGELDGSDLVAGDAPLQICDDGVAPPASPVVTTRIGVNRGATSPWRWLVAGDPNISASPRRSPAQPES